MIEMRITANIDPILKDLVAAGRKNAEFAVQWAARATARDVASEVRKVIDERFAHSPRGYDFLMKHVKVLDSRSTLTRSIVGSDRDSLKTSAWVAIVPPEGKGMNAGWQNYRHSFLPMMEVGGPTPGPRDFGGRTDLGRYAVPARSPRDRTPIPDRMRPMALGLQAMRSIEGPLKAGRLRGQHRTFLLPLSAGHSVIFQRFGRGRWGGVIPLYLTRPQAYLPKRSYFFPTALKVATAKLPEHMRRALTQSLFGRGEYRGGRENIVPLGPFR